MSGALTATLARDPSNAVLTLYKLGVCLFHLYRAGKYEGIALRINKSAPNRQDLHRYHGELLARGAVLQQRGYPAGSWRVSSFTEPTAAAIACAIDPFAAISHFSAMELHGLTDRLPKLLFATTPPPQLWAKLANERMEKDLDGSENLAEYRAAGLPLLRRKRTNKIAGLTLVTQHSSQHISYVLAEGQQVRVTSIGQTFLDMIRKPSYCGGMANVISVWQTHSSRYLRLIVDEIDRNGSPIDKVRAGYLLQERQGLSEPRIENWKQFSQRGGSRRLDAAEPYASEFSETWGISINLGEANA